MEKGTLKGTQTPAVKAHAAVHGLEIPTKDSVVEVEFDDSNYTGAHYRHLCRAQIRLNSVTIIDERNGSLRNDIYEMSKDPAKKAERSKFLTGRSVTYPAQLDAVEWFWNAEPLR